jgi:hypothetical protein
MAVWRNIKILSLCSIICCLPSCTTVGFVSQYDEQTDSDATAIQQDVATFFVKLDTALTPADRSFGANQDFYKREAVAVTMLASRAAAVPKNSLTIQQIELLKENIALLALLHKGCVTDPLTDAQNAAVKANGIDASVACRTDYGASVARPDQSASVLNPALADTAHQLIDQELTAILTLELAKKRGETADGGK